MGTGDGKAAFRYARAHPDTLVVGVEPAWQQAAPMAARAARRRDGAPNLVFVAASAEQPPPQLHGLADEIHATMPWGALLAGLLRPDPAVLAGLAAIARPGAVLRVLIGADAWGPPLPTALREVPAPTAAHLATLEVAYAAHGWAITATRRLGPAEAAAVPSSWARRLAAGRAAPSVVRIDAVRDHTATGSVAV